MEISVSTIDFLISLIGSLWNFFMGFHFFSTIFLMGLIVFLLGFLFKISRGD